MNNVFHTLHLMHSKNNTFCYILSSYMYKKSIHSFLSLEEHHTFTDCVTCSYMPHSHNFMNKTPHFGNICNMISDTLYFYSYTETLLSFLLIVTTFGHFDSFDFGYLFVQCMARSLCYYLSSRNCYFLASDFSVKHSDYSMCLLRTFNYLPRSMDSLFRNSFQNICNHDQFIFNSPAQHQSFSADNLTAYDKSNSHPPVDAD